MINVSQYEEFKTKGLITISKVGDAYAISSKKFDPQTGETLTSEVQSLSIDELHEKKSELLAAIVNIDLVIADCLAAVDVLPVKPIAEPMTNN